MFLSAGGEPSLPYQLVRVLLPPDADLSNVTARLQGKVFEEVLGEWVVRPMPPKGTCTEEGPVTIWPEGKTVVDQRDVAIYGRDAFYPAEVIYSVGTGVVRKYKIADVFLCLFRYNPVTGILLRLTYAELVVSFQRAPSLLHAPESVFGVADPIGEEMVSEMTVNFHQVAPHYRREEEVAREERAAPGQTRELYVIITTREIKSHSKQLNLFVASKELRGFDVLVVTEETWGGGTGDDSAENIRNWLKANYLDLGIKYLLLLGNPNPDWGDVPMKWLHVQNNAKTTLVPLWYIPKGILEAHGGVPSDYYFADLTGNWDLDGDGFVGEAVWISWKDGKPIVKDWGDFGPGGVDTHWDVLVGRIPYYGEMDDLDHILAKIVSYEMEPPQQARWRKKVLLPMKPGDKWTPAYTLGEEIVDGFIWHDGILVPKGGWGYHRVYDDYNYFCSPPEPTQ